ncbi:MAG: hypothetical protein LBI39_00435 [Puniceicoccales bacterium]|nr:hypothetical protein [Puniceicoccales bacterium]
MVSGDNEFFEALERLIGECGITIDRPKGTAHPQFPDLIYPMDYGYINNTQSQDGGGIDVFVGDAGRAEVVAVICSVDLAKRDARLKVLYKCSEENI